MFFMEHLMQILLISGFLGAGKTTFIKELITRTDKKPVIMENEYGANNLDSLELQNSSPKSGEIKVLEFMEGCVCCTMKDSFVNSVFTIYSSIGPEYLIIEPTGVGRLSSIIDNLSPILKTVNSLLPPIVIVSPETYRHNMKEYPDLYTDQIASAKKVIFSKCENTDPAEIEAVSDEIRKINTAAEICGMHYSKMDESWWENIWEGEDDAVASRTASPKKKPEDVFSQVSLQKAGVKNPVQLIQFLEDALRGEFGLVSRAKGTLWVSDEMVRFDLADRMYAITGSPYDECQCVIIGKNLDEKKIRSRLCPTGRAVMR